MTFLVVWRPFGTGVGSIVVSLWMLFWLPNRAVGRVAKTTKSDDVTSFLMFSGSGGVNIYEKT